jgi:hypothetical protein
MNYTRIVLIRNGFELGHGLKTSYRGFIDWFMCKSFAKYYLAIGALSNSPCGV